MESQAKSKVSRKTTTSRLSKQKIRIKSSTSCFEYSKIKRSKRRYGKT